MLAEAITIPMPPPEVIQWTLALIGITLGMYGVTLTILDKKKREEAAKAAKEEELSELFSEPWRQLYDVLLNNTLGQRSILLALKLFHEHGDVPPISLQAFERLMSVMYYQEKGSQKNCKSEAHDMMEQYVTWADSSFEAMRSRDRPRSKSCSKCGSFSCRNPKEEKIP